LHLHLDWWELEPMEVLTAGSEHLDAMFGDSAEIDSAFVMRNIPHTWTPCGSRHLGYLPEPEPTNAMTPSPLPGSSSIGSRTQNA
jgi:hypothetical protein